ncbi:helicase domain protein [Nitzschia inconspicua]|uniref:Helicase domain protein n=1 Tax=Nitzschia inconspicua TaxID=303405 RepID=A0A9K3PW54_9STRA|nr:helicase domain protein [Nitzschia inconspicua]
MSSSVSSHSMDIADEDDRFLGMLNLPSFVENEEKTNLVRMGSNGSPVCVTDLLDTSDSVTTVAKVNGNDNVVVVDQDQYCFTVPPNEEGFEFVDPDKLDEAITELYDPILAMDTDKQGDDHSIMDDKCKNESTAAAASPTFGHKICNRKLWGEKQTVMDLLSPAKEEEKEDQVLLESSNSKTATSFMDTFDDGDATMQSPVTPEHCFVDVENDPFVFEPLPPLRSTPPMVTPPCRLFLPHLSDPYRHCDLSREVVPITTEPSNRIVVTPDHSRNGSFLVRPPFDTQQYVARSLSFTEEGPIPHIPPPAAAAADPTITTTTIVHHHRPFLETTANRIQMKQSLITQKGTSRVKTGKYVPEVWEEYFQLAVDFRKLHGHCCIPYNYPPNPKLAAWAKRQRYQYTLYKRSVPHKVGAKSTSMTAERLEMLNSIDFVWDIQDAQFEIFLMMFRKFVADHGHGKVPKSHSKGGLGRWVGSQRTSLKKGKMSLKRFQKLDEAGFLWVSHSCSSDDVDHLVNQMRMKIKERGQQQLQQQPAAKEQQQ